MPYPSILLVHGAANGAWVWDSWRAALGALGWEVNVLDLRGHGRSLPIDMNEVTMESYVGDLESVAAQIAATQGQHPVVGGWSMGGLVSMMYASKQPEVPCLLLFAPSPPLEVQGKATLDELRKTPLTPFGPELYGVYPADIEASRAAMPDLTDEEIARVLERSAGAEESGLARRQRKNGVSVPKGSIACPSLVVFGEEDAMISPEHSRGVAAHLWGETLAVARAGHWGVAYSERIVSQTAPSVDAWLRRALPEEA
jgi:pimeloyl-ACP methyl ester carboxylesterase